MSKVIERIKSLGIELPDASAPAANYVPYTQDGNCLYISGQIPQINGKFSDHVGKVGVDFTTEEAKKIARICGLNIIAQVNEAVNDLDMVQCIKLGVFVNSTPDFIQHPEVANGASDLMVEVFGEHGKHSRFAVGASSLPRGVAVEVDAIFKL